MQVQLYRARLPGGERHIVEEFGVVGVVDAFLLGDVHHAVVCGEEYARPGGCPLSQPTQRQIELFKLLKPRVAASPVAVPGLVKLTPVQVDEGGGAGGQQFGGVGDARIVPGGTHEFAAAQPGLGEPAAPVFIE